MQDCFIYGTLNLKLTAYQDKTSHEMLQILIDFNLLSIHIKWRVFVRDLSEPKIHEF